MLSLSLIIFVLASNSLVADAGRPDQEVESEYASSIECYSLQSLSDVSMESDGLVIESDASDIDDLGCSLMDISETDESEVLCQSTNNDFHPTVTSTPQRSVSFQNIEKVYATPKPVSAKCLLIKESFASGSKLLQRMTARKNIMRSLLFECSCGDNCIEKMDFETIKVLRYGYWSKNQKQRAQFLIQTLQKNDKKSFRLENDLQVCKKAFMTILQISKNQISMCSKHAIEGNNPPYRRSFRSTTPKTLQCMNWLEQYATLYGDRMPNSRNILLPYRTAKLHVYHKYCREMKEDGNRAVSRAGFSRIWLNNFPNLKIKQTNSFSKCTICTALERREEKETCLEKREMILREKSLHNDRQMFERKYYYSKKDASRKHPKQFLSLIIDGMDQSKTNLPHIVGRMPKIINPADLLKTHLTGVIDHGHQKFTIYIDINQYPHDPNLTMNILLKKLLQLTHDNGNVLPRVLYLQADNCWRENKNRYVMAFFELLVMENIFDEVHISFLFVGHTHEDVDAGFSRIGEFLRRNDAETVEDLLNTIPNSELLNNMFDIKSWLEPHLNLVSKHTAQHHFKFSKQSGKVIVEYKLHQAEEWSKQETTYLFKKPDGKPKILKADVTKLDFERLQKLINSMTFMFSDNSKKKWWDRFLKEKCIIKDSGRKLWIDDLPRQAAIVRQVDNIDVIPETIKRMIVKETQPVKVPVVFIMNYFQTEGSKTTEKNPRYVCKKCVDRSRSYNSQSECKRHIQTFHYGFMYKCTGCGKVYTRKIKRKHNCSSKSTYVLIHKESGLIDTSAVQKKKYLDDQINNDIQKEFNSLPLQLPSRDLESITGVSHYKHYKIKRTYHPYKMNHIKPQLQQLQKEADPSLDLDFVPDPSEIFISQPLAFDENEVEPGYFSDILTTSNELSQMITENYLVQNIQLLGGSDSGLKHEDQFAFDDNEVEPASFNDILTTSTELSQAITEYSPEQNIQLLGDIDSGLKHEDELEKMVGKEKVIINHNLVQTQHWQDDSIILCVGGNPSPGSQH